MVCVPIHVGPGIGCSQSGAPGLCIMTRRSQFRRVLHAKKLLALIAYDPIVSVATLVKNFRRPWREFTRLVSRQPFSRRSRPRRPPLRNKLTLATSHGLSNDWTARIDLTSSGRASCGLLALAFGFPWLAATA